MSAVNTDAVQCLLKEITCVPCHLVLKSEVQNEMPGFNQRVHHRDSKGAVENWRTEHSFMSFHVFHASE